MSALPGPLLFARFAYPPNLLGYCGPGDSRALLDYAGSNTVDGGLLELARGFEGAWPYLQLIAAANRIEDPLDARVVEAYWLGNGLLDRVPLDLLVHTLDGRFRRAAAGDTAHIVDAACAGGTPHHNFHVFAVYPWVGMLRRGFVDAPLRVLDRCRIRWGRVEAVSDRDLLVWSQPLAWRDNSLLLDEPALESVQWRGASGALLENPMPGDVVAMHWDWACVALDPRRLHALQRHTARQLRAASAISHPGPSAVLA